jgi:catechol 2,3-dioxygenase-like lactoylglutathione lyase family enzyme
MRIEAIHHVQLAMPEGGEAKAIGFYEGVLGISQVPKPQNLAARGGCWFERDNLKVHLGVDSNFSPAKKAHTAFLIRDIDAARAAIASAGYDTVDDEPLPGYRRFYASDPFGNRLEFLAPEA